MEAFAAQTLVDQAAGQLTRLMALLPQYNIPSYEAGLIQRRLGQLFQDAHVLSDAVSGYEMGTQIPANLAQRVHGLLNIATSATNNPWILLPASHHIVMTPGATSAPSPTRTPTPAPASAPAPTPQATVQDYYGGVAQAGMAAKLDLMQAQQQASAPDQAIPSGGGAATRPTTSTGPWYTSTAAIVGGLALMGLLGYAVWFTR